MSGNNSENYLRKQVEESEKSKNIYEDSVKALQTEERFVNFFKNYNEADVKRFIEYYSNRKADWYKHADSHYNYVIHKQNIYRDECIDLLKTIYQKKLFDIQCRWIAGEMDLDGIEISLDFKSLMNTPDECKFVEPITYPEFQCLLNYFENKKEIDEEIKIKLMEEEGETEDDEYFDESDYECTPHLTMEFFHDFRARYVGGHNKQIPPWFRFYDRYFKKEDLLNLSLIRKDMEIDWCEIWSEEIHILNYTEEERKNHEPDTRRMRKFRHENPGMEEAYREERNRLYYENEKTKPKYEDYHASGKFLEKIVKELETPEMIANYRAYTTWHRRKRGHDWIDMDIIYLTEIKEWVSIESNDDYREAIQKAYTDYAHKKVMETLPFIFEEYRKCIDSNKPFKWQTDENAPHQYSDDTKRRILEARKLKGEPENFDFLKKNNLPKEYL